MEDVYIRLAKHIENLIMGYPYNEALLDLLREMFTPTEAEVAIAIPNDLAPLDVVDLDTIASRSTLPKATVADALESLSKNQRIFSAKTKSGSPGYALLQVGYGIPQIFFWGGQQDETAKKMAKLILNYFTIPTTGKIYGGVPTKTYKYSPANLAIEPNMQGVMPNEQMGPIVESATKVGLAHCPCRVSANLLGKTECKHSIEVCFKYDEMAELVISKGLAREVSKDEALHILQECEKEGLVHMVDNAQGQIKHTCNCCGHYCWNVGIIRRHKIPRDVLIGSYFIRETNPDECIGCGACEEICPVDAVQMADDKAVVDMDWCIGCGVCTVQCPTEAISIKRRIDEKGPENFNDLHQQIKLERGLG